MGLCFSCCRDDTADDHDHDPLLSQDRRVPSYTDNSLPNPRNHLDKLADLVAALHAGKLPSQEQVNRALRHALASDVFNLHSGEGTRRPPGGAEEEELNELGKELLGCVKESLQALIEFGTEKNGESCIRDARFRFDVCGWQYVLGLFPVGRRLGDIRTGRWTARGRSSSRKSCTQ